MSGRYEDERRRYGESRPGGGRTFEGEHDVGQSRRAGQDNVEGGSSRGSYASRPYASRDEDYTYDPRGDRNYSYSGARGSMVSPEWDHYHGDLGGHYQGDIVAVEFEVKDLSLEEHADKLAEFKAKGFLGAPVVTVGGVPRFCEFNVTEIERIFG